MSKSGRVYFRLGAESYSSPGRVEKKRGKYSRPFLGKFACGQVSSPSAWPGENNLGKAEPWEPENTSIRQLWREGSLWAKFENVDIKIFIQT